MNGTYTRKQVAERLSVTPQRVYQLYRAGKLPAALFADVLAFPRGPVERLRMKRERRKVVA